MEGIPDLLKRALQNDIVVVGGHRQNQRQRGHRKAFGMTARTAEHKYAENQENLHHRDGAYSDFMPAVKQQEKGCVDQICIKKTDFR